MNLYKIDNKWFFTELHPIFKLFLIFIRGDLLILLPLLILILSVGIFSIRMMFILLGAYISVRYFGEMIYWIMQQFSDRSYRAYDFGFKKLDNNAVYIIYQLTSLVGVICGVAIVVYFFLY